VTGVQTCALPIYLVRHREQKAPMGHERVFGHVDEATFPDGLASGGSPHEAANPCDWMPRATFILVVTLVRPMKAVSSISAASPIASLSRSTRASVTVGGVCDIASA